MSAPREPTPTATDSQKLQKVIAASGRGSRRQIEAWIVAGRVEVNGRLAHLGQRVNLNDEIAVDGTVIETGGAHIPQVLVLNKAAGLVCSRRDPEGRNTIFEQLPRLQGGRWITVGRLDIQTTGLLLVTNDGALAHRMMHPSTGLDREYAVRVNKKLEDAEIEQLKAGVEIDGEEMRFSDVRYYNGITWPCWKAATERFAACSIARAAR